MSETAVRIETTANRRGILLALVRKDLKRVTAGLADSARPMVEADRDMLKRYEANLKELVSELTKETAGT